MLLRKYSNSSMSSLAAATDGDRALDALGIPQADVKSSVYSMIRLFISHVCLTWIGLILSKSK